MPPYKRCVYYLHSMWIIPEFPLLVKHFFIRAGILLKPRADYRSEPALGVLFELFFPVKDRFGEAVALVAQLQGEKRDLLLHHAQEDHVALPLRQLRHA